MKTCSKCNHAKALTDFDVSKKYKSGRRSECKSCRRGAYFGNLANEKAKRKEWREANKLLAATNHARWASENAERLAAYQIAYRGAPENKERKAFLKRIYAHVAREKESERNALKLQACPAWANRPRMAEIYQHAANLTVLTREKWHVDHIVPLRSKLVCGLHVAANLQVLTAFENISKGNRYWPDQW